MYVSLNGTDLRFFRNIIAWIGFKNENVCYTSVTVETMQWGVGVGWGVRLQGFSPHKPFQFHLATATCRLWCGIDHTDLNLQTYWDCTLQWYRLCVQSWPVSEQPPPPPPATPVILLPRFAATSSWFAYFSTSTSPFLPSYHTVICLSLPFRCQGSSQRNASSGGYVSQNRNASTRHNTRNVVCFFFLIKLCLGFLFLQKRPFSRNKVAFNKLQLCLKTTLLGSALFKYQAALCWVLNVNYLLLIVSKLAWMPKD